MAHFDERGDVETEPEPKHNVTRVATEPGICGFSCIIEARRSSGLVSIKIMGSECKQIQRLSKSITEISLEELFRPLTRNPVYLLAQQAGCHPSCPVPVAVLKAVEVAMEMALPRDVLIKFE